MCRLNGVWSRQQVDAFLGGACIPLRLGCVGSDGFPRVVSLWFLYQGGIIHCVTHRNSRLAVILRRQQKVGFEVAPNEPPYFGVRGQGMVSVSPLGDADTLEILLERYLGGLDNRLARWLLSRRDEELLIRLEPLRMYSWDYRKRMKDVG